MWFGNACAQFKNLLFYLLFHSLFQCNLTDSCFKKLPFIPWFCMCTVRDNTESCRPALTLDLTLKTAQLKPLKLGFTFIIVQVPVWFPPSLQMISKYFIRHLCIIGSLLFQSPITNIVSRSSGTSVAIKPSHFLFRRIWTLLTVQASAASLSATQQTRQDKQ